MFLWIWNIDSLGTPEEVLNRLNDLSAKDVCIKYHDGYGGSGFKTNFIKYAQVLKNGGIKVGAWGYNYFNYVDQEAGLIVEALNNGAEYYIFDAEGEVEGKAARAEQVLQKVRSAKPNAVLGYAPFPYVSYHSQYPYSVFNKYCNYASPQCYAHEIGTSLKDCIDKTLSDFNAAGLNLPIYPSFEAYGIDDYSVINNYNFENYGFWDLDEMSAVCEAFITNGKTSSVTPPVTGNAVVRQLQENLNTLIRAGLAVDGLYGTLTTSAVIKFQGIMGLVQDGIAGRMTNGAINEIMARPLDGVPMPHYEYATRWIQWRVGAGIDGIYGSKTEAKVKQFQTNCNDRYGANLAVDGIVGPMTWNALFKYWF